MTSVKQRLLDFSSPSTLQKPSIHTHIHQGLVNCAEVRWDAELKPLSLCLPLFLPHLWHICGTFRVYSWVWNSNVAKRKITSKRKFGLWATILFRALIFPAHHAVGLNRFSIWPHIPVTDECVSVLQPVGRFYSCATCSQLFLLKLCCNVSKPAWIWDTHVPWISSQAHNISVCNDCTKTTAVELSEDVANTRLRTKQVWWMSKKGQTGICWHPLSGNCANRHCVCVCALTRSFTQTRDEFYTTMQTQELIFLAESLPMHISALVCVPRPPVLNHTPPQSIATTHTSTPVNTCRLDSFVLTALCTASAQ